MQIYKYRSEVKMVNNCSAVAKLVTRKRENYKNITEFFWLAEFEAIFKGKLHTFDKTLTLNAYNAFKNSLHYFEEKYFKRV